MGSLIRRNPGAYTICEPHWGQESLPQQMWFWNEGIAVGYLCNARPCHDDKKDDLDYP